ncbi:MAG: hypothetical protein MPN21_27870, partial [Thermoanaerobaculia bacterium]|nr:hypothetical protein [Thermoanaerobaculia bacterium]
FSFFLSWTALLLFVNESLSQRAYRELYLNEVDSLMMSREKQAMLSDNGPLQSQTHGFALASRATTSSSNHV